MARLFSANSCYTATQLLCEIRHVWNTFESQLNNKATLRMSGGLVAELTSRKSCDQDAVLTFEHVLMSREECENNSKQNCAVFKLHKSYANKRNYLVMGFATSAALWAALIDDCERATRLEIKCELPSKSASEWVKTQVPKLNFFNNNSFDRHRSSRQQQEKVVKVELCKDA